MKSRLAYLLLCCLLLCSSQALTTQAMGSGSIWLVDVNCSDPTFGSMTVAVEFTAPLTDDNGTGGDIVGIYFYDETWGRLHTGGQRPYTSSLLRFNAGYGFNKSVQELHILVVDVDNSLPFMASPDYSEIATFPILDQLDFTIDELCPPDEEGSEPDEVVEPPDNRINWGYGDSHLAVLYPTEGGLGLYDYASDSYVDLFFAEDIAAYEENPPDEPVLIAEYGAVRAYYLPSGEIQFNIGPDAEGKEYVYIIESLENPSGYGYYIDPNE